MDPVGFILSRESERPEEEIGKLAFLTDLGEVTPSVRSHLHRIEALVMETNHDEKMLLNGPYPWPVKQRVRGTRGHLSNAAAAELISRVVRDTGITRVTLAHLSQNNNHPNLARDTVLEQVEKDCGRTITVQVASQDYPMEEIIITEEDS